MAHALSFDPERYIPHAGETNVSNPERILTGAAGIAAAVWGLRRADALGLAAAVGGGVLLYRALSGHCDAYASVGLDTRHGRPKSEDELHRRGIHVRQSVTIDRPIGDVYAFWRRLENLPLFMHHLQSVEEIDERRSWWVAKGPANRDVAWEAEITEDVPNECVAWATTADADVPNAGRVEFRPAPGNRGTEVHVEIDYAPPAMRLGALLARLFGENPKQQIAGDLRRLKSHLETGETATNDPQPTTRESSRIPAAY